MPSRTVKDPVYFCNWFCDMINYSVIRQKGESQNGCYKKTKPAEFSEKRTFVTPWE